MSTTLLFLLFTCHWLADYTPLSTPTMLKAKATGSPMFPIMVHGAAHGVLMGIVVLLFTFQVDLAIFVTIAQGYLHFMIDLWKGRMNVWFPALKDTTKYPHWVIFGLDQLLHAIVIILIAENVAKHTIL